MAISAQDLDFIQKFLDEHYSGKFEIVDLFKTDPQGRMGHSIRSINNPSICFSFLGTSDIYGLESNPVYIEDRALYANDKFGIAFQKLERWLSLLEL